MSWVSLQQDQGRETQYYSQTSGNCNFNIGTNRKKHLSEKLLKESKMAFLPSDDIWEKFDLAGTCVSSNDEFDLEAIMDETFADLGDFAQDFGIADAPQALDDPFAVKEEPDAAAADMFDKQIEEDFMIKEEVFMMNEDDSTSSSSSCDFLNGLNLTDFTGLEPDTLKSDCMWSSTLTHLIESQQSKGRKRDFSLTLSECNEGMKEIMGSSPPTFLGSSLLTGASLNPFIETPLATSASESDTESTSTDEEIDVVSSDDNDMYRRQLVRQQQRVHNNSSSKKIPHIEPGRSLLLSRNRSPKPGQRQPESGANANYCQQQQQQTFIDHSYFLVRPPSPQRSTGSMIQGMLTPTESSDDDESISTQFISSNVSGSIDKRKIVQAVQSLIKNNKQSLLNCANKRMPASDNIKFKFRMKFKSSSQQHSLLAVNNRCHNNMKRKSATSNFHCPSPTENRSKEPVSILNTHHRGSTSTPPSPSKPGLRNVKSSRTSSGSSSSSSRSTPNNHEQKCREIRDLHNSMERQRRVDLRKNFDQLKAVVPELADTEKASKLNILNKASDYCKLLATLDIKLRKDVEKESSRNAILRKKLAALQSHFNNSSVGGSVRLSTGRVSLVHARR